MKNWSPYELAEEAREALRNNPETPRDHFARLIRIGFINARGQVTRLLGGQADPEPEQKGGPSATAASAR